MAVEEQEHIPRLRTACDEVDFFSGKEEAAGNSGSISKASDVAGGKIYPSLRVARRAASAVLSRWPVDPATVGASCLASADPPEQRKRHVISEYALAISVPSGAYAGDVFASECWQVLAEHPASVLVDVRSHPEWVFAGHSDLSSLGKRAMLLSWRLYPDFEINPGFVAELSALLPEKDVPVFFLCKVGGRSAEAAGAMAGQGYGKCFNVVYGFEGEPDAVRRRGRVNGWKAEELPWVQA